VGENEIDHLVSVYNYSDTFVPFIKFMNDSTAFAVAESSGAQHSCNPRYRVR